MFFLITSCGRPPLLKKLSKENGSTGAITALDSPAGFKTTGQEIKIQWLTAVNTNGECKAIVILTKNGSIFSDDRFTLGAFLWMKSMGHGSSPIVVTKIAEGIYQLSEMYFTMTGSWQLHVTLNQGNKVIEDKEYDYTINL